MRIAPLPAALLLLVPSVFAENWPAWRGPASTGAAAGPAPVREWSTTRNVLWRTPLPEPGNSTPVVWGDAVFVTQARKGGHRLVLCLDRATGRLRWEAGVKADADEPTHATNPYASASPAVDGERVVAWFGTQGLVAFDMQGKQIWRVDLGVQKHTWGYGSSPVIAGNRVFLNFGPGEQAFVAAFDKRTGKELWRRPVPPGKGSAFSNWSAEDMYGTWSSPSPVAFDERLEILVSLPRRLVAFDPSDGRELWSAEGLGDLIYPSPVASEAGIVAASGFGGPIMAVKRGGERLWRQEKGRSLIGSPVITGGHFYMVDNNGIAHCVKLATGETVWSQRLQGSDDNGVWSSPVLHESTVYVMNKSGRVHAFAAEPKYTAVGTWSLEEPSNASVVLVDGVLYLRTDRALWAIGAKR